MRSHEKGERYHANGKHIGSYKRRETEEEEEEGWIKVVQA